MRPPLLDRPAIVVKQRRKLFELVNEYDLLDPATGEPVGAVRQVRQGAVAVLLRVFSDLDVALPTTLEVRDADGALVLTCHKPWFRWATAVTAGDGTLLGTVTKQIRLGKARFGITGGDGAAAGELRALNWRAKDFTVVDTADREVARVTKKWRGALTELFTDADTYVVELPETTDEPLRSLAVGAVFAVDVVMKQKDT